MKTIFSFLIFCVLLLSRPAVSLTDEGLSELDIAVEDRNYQPVILANLSKLYWRMGVTDISNDDHIDNYVLINDCDVYNDYFSDEFQWKDIRQSIRTHLDKHATKFPRFFEFRQPLQLGEYRVEKQAFDIHQDYAIYDVRHFEVLVPGYELSGICGRERPLEGYPKGMLLDFNRHVRLTELPVPKEKAQEYISKRTAAFKAYAPRFQTKENLYKLRDAHIFYKVTILSFRDVEKVDLGYKRAKFAAILDGFEVYSDEEKANLLYSKQFKYSREAILLHLGKGASTGVTDVKGRLQ